MEKLIKQLLWIVILLVSSHSLMAQEVRIDQDEVPLKIQAKFFGRYKEVTDVNWKSLPEDKIKAHFYTKNREVSVLYDRFGKISEIENISGKAVLTDEVSNHLAERFPGNKIVVFKKVTRFYIQGTSEPQHYFEIILKEGRKKTSVFFNNEMQLMRSDNIFNLAVN